MFMKPWAWSPTMHTPCVVIHCCLSTQEVEAGGAEVQDNPWLCGKSRAGPGPDWAIWASILDRKEGRKEGRKEWREEGGRK